MNKTIRLFSFFAVVFALFLASCGTSSKVAAVAEKAVPAFIGNWAYDLETPQGNMPGTMIIEQVGDVIKGRFETDMGSVDMDGLKIENNMLKTSIDVNGMIIDVMGTFKDAIFDGKMMVDGYEMPFQAKKETK